MLKNSYTDAPELHPNLILGSLHLLFWLVFHPSAWCNYTARIDSGLSPNFTLTDLNQAQWTTPALWRLCVQGYLILPLLAGLATGLTLWLQGVSPAAVVTPVMYTTFLSLAIGLMVSAVVGVAAGIASGAAVGLAVGVVASVISNEVTAAVAVSAALGVAVGHVLDEAEYADGVRLGLAHLGLQFVQHATRFCLPGLRPLSAEPHLVERGRDLKRDIGNRA